MFFWFVAFALFIVWLLGVLLSKGGFLHILLLCAIAIVVVQFVADRRAAQG